MSLKVSGLDDLDLQILDILLKDSRTPFLEIARNCHVSGGTIHVRMKKMQDMNIIKGTGSYKGNCRNSLYNWKLFYFYKSNMQKYNGFAESAHEQNSIC